MKRLILIISAIAFVWTTACSDSDEFSGTDFSEKIRDANLKRYCRLVYGDSNGEISETAALALRQFSCNSNYVNPTTGQFVVQPHTINSLDGLEIFANLRSLYLECIAETSCDLSRFSYLEDLTYTNSYLTSINVSKNTGLRELNVSGCKLSSLDVTALTELRTLECRSNPLVTLDISRNRTLELLDCTKSGNLTTIYVWEGFDVENPPIEIYTEENTKLVVKN